ncbi:3'-5' exonuclease [Porphyromonadaceae bacterium W3.11]|nr:3'-5' exonuclease [Porphyromonadaceae bacterium W3.11]
MMLQLERPIVFFDLETTGLDISNDRIVEISLLKVFPDNSEEMLHTLINPEMPIPASSTEVHKISNEMVADKPTFRDMAKRIAAFIENCDLGGYNCIRFDIPLLAEEFHRVEVPIDLKASRKVIDAQVIFHKKEARTLSAAYKFYCGKDLEGAHAADVDTRATYEVLLGQLEMYDDLPKDVEALGAFTRMNDNVDFAGRMIYDKDGEVRFNFGKYKGQLVKDVLRNNQGYYEWMMQSNFPHDTKLELTRIKISVESN